jgi:hypothetical protein
MVFGGIGLDPALNWTDPCPIPPERMTPTQPPMYFCMQHFESMMNRLQDTFERLGIISYDVPAGAPDEFDRLMRRLYDQGQ